FFIQMLRRSPKAPLFPYTTLFRSKLFDQRTRGSKVGGTICSSKICKVAEEGNSASNVAPGVFLGVHPLDVLFTVELTNSNGFDRDRKSTRLNSSHRTISYAVFCLK